jgi:protein-tyrosine-phosphatase
MRRTIRERNILFVCEDNARLSQMAEAMAKHLGPPKIRIFSAGVKPSAIPAQVHRVMEEIGISLGGQSTKSVSQVPLGDIDLVVSFGDAGKKCGPLPPKAKLETWPLPHPTRSDSSNPSTLAEFREERDEIDKRISALFLDYWRNVA